MIEGILSVYAQGLQILYPKKIKQEVGMLDSFVLHPPEVEKILSYSSTPDPETRAGFEWSQEMHKILHPNFLQKTQRLILTFYNMLKDAFGQAAKAIIGALSKDTSFSKVKDSNKRIEEVRSGLTELVPNAWEPILEKYRGRRVVIERKGADSIIYESGVLEDYSSKYLLLREVVINEPELLKKISQLQNKKSVGVDILFSRKIAIIRHTVDDSSNESSTA